jgi:hypothetical protein
VLVGVQAGDFVGNDLEGMVDQGDCQVKSTILRQHV